jgi:hypothetical protein
MQTVSTAKVVDAQDAVEEPLPPRIQEALGEFVGAAKEGLLALSVGVGLGVLEELMTEEVEEVCGPRGRHNPERVAYRHGSDGGEVTLGGRRAGVMRPRMRSKDGREELPVRTFGVRAITSAAALELRPPAHPRRVAHRRHGHPAARRELDTLNRGYALAT